MALTFGRRRHWDVFKRFIAALSLAGVLTAGIGPASWGAVSGAGALVVQQWRPQGAR
jgi:hypothetical protein